MITPTEVTSPADATESVKRSGDDAASALLPARSRGISSQGELYHARNSRGLVTPTWYTRVLIACTRVVFALGSRKDRAILLDRDLRAKLRAGNPPAEVKQWLASQLGDTPCASTTKRIPPPETRPPNLQEPSLRDILQAHQKAYFEAKPSTTVRYEFCLLNLVETALRHRQGLGPTCRAGRRVTLADYGDVPDLSVAVLDDVLVADFKAARMVGVERLSSAEKSRKISTNTELRHARCMFSAEAKLAYKRAGLQLPDLAGFLTAPRFNRVVCRPELPADETIVGLFDGIRTLAADSDADLFFAIALATYAGLRREEILHAERSWLQTTSGPSLVVRLATGFRPKNDNERTVPIPVWLYDRLAARPVGASLLTGDLKMRDRILDRVVGWLRSHGFSATDKPLHALRGLYAAYLLATENSPIRIKSRLGHADLTTTFRYYANEPLADRLAKLWTEPIV